MENKGLKALVSLLSMQASATASEKMLSPSNVH